MARPHTRHQPQPPSWSLTSSSSLPSDASPERSHFSRHIKELSGIYRRFNHFISSSETAIKIETARVHKSVQHLISSRNMGEVEIFRQIPVHPRTRSRNALKVANVASVASMSSTPPNMLLASLCCCCAMRLPLFASLPVQAILISTVS